MMQRRWIFILIINILYDESTARSPESKEKQIKELEVIKSDLFKKLNEAIEDSVKALEKNNDTDSMLTVGDMKDLKKQVDLLNASVEVDTKVDPVKADSSSSDTDVDGNVTRQEPAMGKKSENDQKQKGSPKNLRRASMVGDSKLPRINVDLRDLVKLLKDKGDLLDMQKESKHLLEIKKKAEAWIEARQKEKEKIKSYRAQMYKTERCPRFGKKQKKKSLSRRKKSKKKKRRGPKTYPCCRKCCKKSYLGCL